MGDLPYISSEQAVHGLIIGTELINEYTLVYLYKNFELKRGWAYNSYYTVAIAKEHWLYGTTKVLIRLPRGQKDNCFSDSSSPWNWLILNLIC